MLAIIIILELLGAVLFYATLNKINPGEMGKLKLGRTVSLFWPFFVAWQILRGMWSLNDDKSDGL